VTEDEDTICNRAEHKDKGSHFQDQVLGGKLVAFSRKEDLTGSDTLTKMKVMGRRESRSAESGPTAAAVFLRGDGPDSAPKKEHSMPVTSASPERTPTNVPDPHPAAAYRLGGHLGLLPGLLIDWRDFSHVTKSSGKDLRQLAGFLAGSSNQPWVDFVVTLNEMDSAVIALGAKIEPVIRDDVRKAIKIIKEDTDPEINLHDSIRYASVLASELDRAFSSDQSLHTWYKLGRAVGKYYHMAKTTTEEVPLPGFEFVLEAVRAAYEERGSEIPLLRKIIELEPQFSSLGPRQVLHRVLEWNGLPIFSHREDFLEVQDRMLDLHDELYKQLTKLTSPVGGSPAPRLTVLEERVLREVRRRALTADSLQRRLRVDRKRLFKDGIHPLNGKGLLINDRKRGGYFDPTHPPESI
jgi:hypothetical protein